MTATPKRYRVGLTLASRYSIEVLARDAAQADRIAQAIYDQSGSTEEFEPDFHTTEFNVKEVPS
jgi:hypothetical protein